MPEEYPYPQLFEVDGKGKTKANYNMIGTYGSREDAEFEARYYSNHGHKVLIEKANDRYYVYVKLK